MAQNTYIARKGFDADFAAVTCDSLVVNTATVEAGSIVLKDDESITIGTGSDVQVLWDSTNLIVKAAADESVIEIGDAAATQKSFDLKWYANEANGASYLYADASANLIYTVGVDIQLKDDDVLAFGTGAGAGGDVSLTFNSTSLIMASAAASVGWTIGAAGNVINTTLTGTLTVGVDGTGYDVKAFGATPGCSLLWDESEDQLVITGPADVPALKIAGAGSVSAAAYAAAGAPWNDGDTPAFAADQMYMMVDIEGTVYRIPLWANS